MLESQIHYVLQALALLRRGDMEALDVRPAVQRAYSTMWPDHTFRYRIVDRLNPGDYEIERVPRTPAAA